MPYECPHCSSTFKRSGHLTRHLVTHSQTKPYNCTHPSCDKSFTRSDNLRRHLLSHATTTEQQLPFTCSLSKCAKSFSTKQRLNRHEDLHNRPTPFKCKICSESFAKKKVLSEHVTKAHEDIKTQHTCTYENCDSTFISPSHLKRHERNVHIEKTYICMDDACVNLEPFTKFSDLQRHLRRDHRKINEKKCRQCGKLFRTLSGLKNHETNHNVTAMDRLVFRCQFKGCNNIYTSSSNLGTHVRSKHTDVDCYVCDVCEFTFSLSGSLKRHMLNVHNLTEQDFNQKHDQYIKLPSMKEAEGDRQRLAEEMGESPQQNSNQSTEKIQQQENDGDLQVEACKSPSNATEKQLLSSSGSRKRKNTSHEAGIDDEEIESNSDLSDLDIATTNKHRRVLPSLTTTQLKNAVCIN